jgi:hypothetical protein
VLGLDLKEAAAKANGNGAPAADAVADAPAAAPEEVADAPGGEPVAVEEPSEEPSDG